MRSIENNFIKIKVLKIRQLDKDNSYLFVGKIKFKELNLVHKMTERLEDYNSDPINKKDKIKDDQEFQRHLNAKKLKDISKYISEKYNNIEELKDTIAFQTPLILAGSLNEEDSNKIDEDEIMSKYESELNCCFISEDEEYIYIPRNERIILIVDGQHRFSGLKLFYEKLDETNQKIIDEFEFAANFVLGLDIFNIGEIFATINFEQKPVNKSLYYDIFGSIPDSKGKNDIKLGHDLTLHMQNNEESPLRGMIKLLGRGQGFFSQAFFVENLMPHFRKNGVWRELYLKYVEGSTEHKKIAVFLKTYFRVIKNCYTDAWVKDEDNRLTYNFILNKTTGMSAFLRLIRDIYPLVKNDLNNSESKLNEIFSKISKDDANLLFVSDIEKYKEKFPNKPYEISNKLKSKETPIASGMFGKSGSVSQQSKLYSILKENLL